MRRTCPQVNEGTKPAKYGGVENLEQSLHDGSLQVIGLLPIQLRLLVRVANVMKVGRTKEEWRGKHHHRRGEPGQQQQANHTAAKHKLLCNGGHHKVPQPNQSREDRQRVILKRPATLQRQLLVKERQHQRAQEQDHH